MSNNLKPDAAGDAAKRNRGSTTIVSFKEISSFKSIASSTDRSTRVNADMMICGWRDIKG
jgi:hypothetical protein